MEPLRRGDKIYSTQFGRGEVLDVEGHGDGQRVRVKFEEGPERVLVREQFELERIEGDLPSQIPLQSEISGTGYADESEATMSREEIRDALREALEDLLSFGGADLGSRWTGGTMVLRPGKGDTQAKEIPLDTFFHKIVMVRDQLRVLEQKINANPRLTDEEKVGLQQYVTRCYGSLTTFNVLFRSKEESFGGGRKS